CFCATAEYGNASTRMAVVVPSSGNFGLWRVPRHRSTVPAAAHRNRPREARDDAASDPENPDRADAVCADLRLFLAERARAARRGSLADEDRSVSVVGAARGCPPETAMSPRIVHRDPRSI